MDAHLSTKDAAAARLAVKVCKLFYQDHLTKTEIEKRLHISRFKVARILKQALQDGLVKIEIAEPDADLSDLESRLESATGLNNVVLVWDDGESTEHLKKKVGQMAAVFLQEILSDGDVLGIGWGSTTFELVNALPDSIVKKVSVVQVSGGNTKLTTGIDSQALTISLAQKFGLTPHLLHAPAIVDRPETREVLIKESSFRDIFRLYQKIDILIAGIGAFLPDRFVGSRFIDSAEMETLRSHKAVGELLYYCFDIEGNLCHTETLNRIIAVPIESIKRVPCSIGIAAGHEKAKAIVGALRSGLIDSLITDSTTAKTILQEIRTNH